MSIISAILTSIMVLSPISWVVCLGLFYIFRAKAPLLILNLIVFIVVSLCFYGTYFERFKIVVTEQQINADFKAKIIVISDLHLSGYTGIWKSKDFLEKVVDKINAQENVDAVLVAGDWTYHPDVKTMHDVFWPLQSSKFPVYGVFGNHDVGKPGPFIRNELADALSYNKVKLLNNDILKLDKFDLVGLGDFWNKEDKVDLLQNPELNLKKTIVLTHQPDTTAHFLANFTPALTVTGHTHCGQVRTFGLYKHLLPVINKTFDKGYYDLGDKGKLWISCGLGEVGAPIRLENPPSIDILTLN